MAKDVIGEQYAIDFLEFLIGRKPGIPGILEEVIRKESPGGSIQGLYGLKRRMSVETWDDIVSLEEVDISQGHGDRIALSGVVEGNRVLLNLSPREQPRSNGAIVSGSINNQPISRDNAEAMVELFIEVRRAQTILNDIPAALTRFRQKSREEKQRREAEEKAFKPLAHLIRS